MKTLSNGAARLMILATFAALVGNAWAERYPEKGTVSYTVVKREAISTPHNTGQSLAISQANGTYVVAGDQDHPLNGSEATSVTYSNTIKGNGSAEGWVAFNKNGDAVYIKTVMQVTTTMGAEGKPVTSGNGTYEKVGGTGQFKNMKGSGAFTVKFTSPTTYDVNIDGWVEQ